MCVESAYLTCESPPLSSPVAGKRRFFAARVIPQHIPTTADVFVPENRSPPSTCMPRTQHASITSNIRMSARIRDLADEWLVIEKCPLFTTVGTVLLVALDETRGPITSRHSLCA